MRRLFGAFLVWAMALGATANEFCDQEGATQEIRRQNDAQWVHFKAKNFRELDAFYSGLVAQYEAGKISDDRLARSLGAFMQQQPGVETLVQEWIRQYPGSYAARYALAAHYVAAGWAARGNAFIPKTSDEQLAGMGGYFRKAWAALDEADRLTRKPALSIALRINMAPALDAGDATTMYKSGIKAFPDSLQIRIEYIRKSGPKWGGSVGRLRSIVDDARGLSEADRRYVRYLALQETGIYYQNNEQFAEAADYYRQSAALCAGVDNSMHLLVYAQRKSKDYPGAIATATEMIRRAPRDGYAWFNRAYAYQEMLKYEQAVEDYRKAADLGYVHAYFNLGYYYENGKVVAQDFKKAMELYLIAADRNVEGAMAQAQQLHNKTGTPLR